MSLHVAPSLKFKPPLEGVTQKQIVTLFRSAGVHVGNTSQYRQSHIEEGIPDLICHALTVRLFFWFEVKGLEVTWTGPAGPVRFNPYDRSTWRPKELRPKQLEFRERARACGVLHFFGGFIDAENALVELKLGYRTQGGQFYLGRPR